MPERSATHLVLIPSFNPGKAVYDTVRMARQQWDPVWVVVDGSDDGTAAGLQTLAAADPGLRVIVRTQNCGKGAAVMHGIELAHALGFTHVLTMDSDGQHPPACIQPFMLRSQQRPHCMVLGVPQFDASAPRLRVQGRRLSNGWANLETLWMGIGDSLFGFRVYPIEPLLQVMKKNRWMRRFDFDPEAAVRLCWNNVPPLNMPAPVKYLGIDEGGVSHFNYVRDNILLTWMHTRLLCGFLIRLPLLIYRRIFAHK